MVDLLATFERVTRRAYQVSDNRMLSSQQLHAFDARNIFPNLPAKVRRLFDDGHYAESTFEAFKFVDKEVARISKHQDTGFNLMMQAFNESSPSVRLNKMIEITEINEQKGYKFLFAGSVLAIRNPRGHEHSQLDDVDTCLDHLAFASLLLRRLQQAGLLTYLLTP